MDLSHIGRHISAVLLTNRNLMSLNGLNFTQRKNHHSVRFRQL